MGCLISRQSADNENSALEHRKKAVPQRATIVSLAEVSQSSAIGQDVVVGDHTRPHNTEGVNIILVFGGPGSRKGDILEYLSKDYGFVTLCVEDLVIECAKRDMAAKAQEESITTEENQTPTATGTGTAVIRRRDVEAYLKVNGSTVTMTKALNLVVEEIRKAPSQAKSFVIDVIPNSRVLLHETSLLKQGTKTLSAFDRSEFHIRFALNLISSNPIMPHSSQTKPDEVDPEKFRRRSIIQSAAVEPYISMFELSQRHVRLPTGGGFVKSIGHLEAFMDSRSFPKKCNERYTVLLCDDFDFGVAIGNRLNLPVVEAGHLCSVSEIAALVNNSQDQTGRGKVVCINPEAIVKDRQAAWEQSPSAGKIYWQAAETANIASKEIALERLGYHGLHLSLTLTMLMPNHWDATLSSALAAAFISSTTFLH